jgi:hypothetical protein
LELALRPQVRPDRSREQSYRESEDDLLFERRASERKVRWNFALSSTKQSWDQRERFPADPPIDVTSNGNADPFRMIHTKPNVANNPTVSAT